MKAIKCSRCGKYQDTAAVEYGTAKKRMCVKKIGEVAQRSKPKTVWYDLCESCTDELENWILNDGKEEHPDISKSVE